MRHAASRRLHVHWDALRAGRAAPGRDEIDPAAIRDVLASVFVIDIAARPLSRRGDATFRLSGTRLDALFGRALRGSGFDRIWAAGSAALVAAALDGVRHGRRPVTAAARGGPPGCEPVDLELVLLPLDARAGFDTPVLGCLSAVGTPAWMGLSAAAPLTVLSLGPPRIDARPPSFGRRGARPFTVHAGERGGRTPAGPWP